MFIKLHIKEEGDQEAQKYRQEKAAPLLLDLSLRWVPFKIPQIEVAFSILSAELEGSNFFNFCRTV